MFGAIVTFAGLGVASGVLLTWLENVPTATWPEEAALAFVNMLLGCGLWWGISGFTLMLHTLALESEPVERYGALPPPSPRTTAWWCIAKATHPSLWLPLGFMVALWAT